MLTSSKLDEKKLEKTKKLELNKKDIYKIFIDSLHGSIVRCIKTVEPEQYVVSQSCDATETTYDERTVNQLKELLKKSRFKKLPYTLFISNSGDLLTNKRYTAKYNKNTYDDNFDYYTLSCLIKLKLNGFPVTERVINGITILSISLLQILDYLSTIENYSELTIIIFDRTCNYANDSTKSDTNAMGGKSKKNKSKKNKSKTIFNKTR